MRARLEPTYAALHDDLDAALYAGCAAQAAAAGSEMTRHVAGLIDAQLSADASVSEHARAALVGAFVASDPRDAPTFAIALGALSNDAAYARAAPNAAA